MSFKSREESDYTSHYCEENVYKYLEKVEDIRGFYVVIISNKNRQIPLWGQNINEDDPDLPVMWDYHVILIRKGTDGAPSLVFDFDSKLDFPVDFNTYYEQTMKYAVQNVFTRYFRVFPALTYLSCFSSDRRHMRDARGHWIMPPPAWEPIVQKDLDNFHSAWIEMKKPIYDSEIYDEMEFCNFFKP
ncbi:unnamed protein product [Caenorhabditis bovis]|uniref:Protein N-terminal glutamine amidohydrolase n=1 Tax=Caenorhabditis bovis TaxID=2654633 RepID=A0A8S1F0P2_9PELO|nr:unnamed protein product [Caenorhabditis bovis]